MGGDNMKKINDIIKQMVIKQGTCAEGLSSLQKLGDSTPEVIQSYIKHIDYCLATNTPNKDFIKENFSEDDLSKNGIYIDNTLYIENEFRSIILGACEAEIVIDGYNTSRIYAKHTSKLNIIASGRAHVLVDTLDDAEVKVSCCDDAVVIVYLYSRATCTGATKIVHKNKETYEL